MKNSAAMRTLLWVVLFANVVTAQSFGCCAESVPQDTQCCDGTPITVFTW
jgi:hypothetical protein